MLLRRASTGHGGNEEWSLAWQKPGVGIGLHTRPGHRGSTGESSKTFPILLVGKVHCNGQDADSCRSLPASTRIQSLTSEGL